MMEFKNSWCETVFFTETGYCGNAIHYDEGLDRVIVSRKIVLRRFNPTEVERLRKHGEKVVTVVHGDIPGTPKYYCHFQSEFSDWTSDLLDSIDDALDVLDGGRWCAFPI